MTPASESPAAKLSGTRRNASLLGAQRQQSPRQALARRRWYVGIGKRLLPLVAVALLASIALWPEFHRDPDRDRLSYSSVGGVSESGRLTKARYHGVDQSNQPYTITAATARQVGPDRVDMTAPVGDINLSSGTWLSASAANGVYLQKSEQLDLSGDVTLYRDDGTTLTTDSAALDVQQGAAAGAAMTHVEGPFGTLDAQGFSIVDSGAIVRFPGPGRMVLNGATR